MSTTPHILVIFGSTRQARRGEAVANWLMDRLAQRTHATVE
jgi:NAD(P)H-dependent FMN reductase